MDSGLLIVAASAARYRRREQAGRS
jgi:hypothetical protein